MSAAFLKTLAVVPVAARDAAEEAAAPYLLGASRPGRKLFGIALNASGSRDDPATHYACCPVLGPKTAAALPALAAALGAAYFPPVATTDWDTAAALAWLLSKHDLRPVPAAPPGRD